MDKFKKDKRINDILLGPLERPALKWFASKMPSWITPDILTGIGVFASILIGLSYYLTNFSLDFLWLASFGFVLNWFGDSLDGTLARFRKIERPKYGFYVDHTFDSLSEFLILLGLGLSSLVQLEFALIALTGYLLMSIHAFVKIYVTGIFRISYSKVGPTEIRLLVIIINTLIYYAGNAVIPIYPGLTLFDVLVLLVGIALIITFIANILSEAIQLNRLEKQEKRSEL